MSQEAVKAFFEKVETDEDTRNRYKSLLKGMADDGTDEEQALSQAVQFAAGEGYTFTSEDLKLAAENMPNGDLNDAQLDAVAGGGVALGLLASGGDGWGSVCVAVGLTW